MHLRSYARTYELVMRDDTTDEDLAKMQIPEAIIERVMENIARSAKRRA